MTNVSNVCESKTFSWNPPWRKNSPKATVHLRCILTGQGEIYKWMDAGYGELMYVTLLTDYLGLLLLNGLFVEAVWGRRGGRGGSACGRPGASSLFLKKHTGKGECNDSDYCRSAAGFFLPPHSSWSSTVGSTQCHLGAYLMFVEGQQEASI